MEYLLINPSDISKTTILGGNVDKDKYRYCIYNAQLTTIEPLLGTELYQKIITDLQANILINDYLKLYENIIKPMLKNEALAEYLEVASYQVTNGGIFKHAPDSSEVVQKEEAQYLAQKYHRLAETFVLKFEKFMCKNSIPEYKTCQDEVNASKGSNLSQGWYL